MQNQILINPRTMQTLQVIWYSPAEETLEITHIDENNKPRQAIYHKSTEDSWHLPDNPACNYDIQGDSITFRDFFNRSDKSASTAT